MPISFKPADGFIELTQEVNGRGVLVDIAVDNIARFRARTEGDAVGSVIFFKVPGEPIFVHETPLDIRASIRGAY